MTARIRYNGAVANATTVTTSQDEEDILEGAVIDEIDQGDMAATTKVITVQSSPPVADGEVVWNTAAHAASGPDRQLQAFDSTNGIVISFANITYGTATPGPEYQVNSQLWYDETLSMLRIWRDATADKQGVAGWHPVSAAFELWKNETGTTDMVLGNVVVHNQAGTDGVRAFTTTVIEKNQLVRGVCMEAIVQNAYGVIAVVGGGATVDVLVRGVALPVAKGDAIVTSTTAGEAREAGPLPGNAVGVATNLQFGIPVGAFGEAMEAQAANGLCSVKLLNAVGTGMFVGRRAALIYDNDGIGPGGDTVTLTSSSTNTIGGQAVTNDLLVDLSHSPIIAANIEVFIQANDPGDDCFVTTSFQTTAGQDDQVLIYGHKHSGSVAGNSIVYQRTAVTMVRTSVGGSATVPGNEVIVKSQAATVMNDFQLYLVGYWC